MDAPYNITYTINIPKPERKQKYSKHLLLNRVEHLEEKPCNHHLQI